MYKNCRVGLGFATQSGGPHPQVTLLVAVLLLLATTPTRGAGTAKTRPAVGRSAYAEGPPCHWSARDSTTYNAGVREKKEARRHVLRFPTPLSRRYLLLQVLAPHDRYFAAPSIPLSYPNRP